MSYRLFQLDNGIRVLFNKQTSTITHTCLIVNVGSRDEKEGNFGIAHFIEHMLFKQTEKRSTKQILNSLESVGGDLNAYTTKEYTCIHASVLNPYLGKALDVFEDIIWHSTFPEDEIEKERGVILDEMASYLDSPEESIMDDFEDLLFQGSGLGHNILGVEKDLQRIRREDIQRFIAENYAASDIAIGISGDYSEKEVERLVHRIFHTEMKAVRPTLQEEPLIILPESKVQLKPINQVHYVLGSKAYGIYDDRKVPTMLLNNMLGGMGMTSILNLSIREKYGIAYTIESNFSLYKDQGFFSIYLGTDEQKIERALKLVQKELDKLRLKPISAAALRGAKVKDRKSVV